MIVLGQKHLLEATHGFGLCLAGACSVSRGDIASGLEMLSTGRDRMIKTGNGAYAPLFVAEFAKACGAAGRINEGLAAIDKIELFQDGMEYWCLPEVLRTKGELLLMQGEGNVAAAGEHFERSLELAREQGALSWELRTAVSFARLRLRQGQLHEAREQLAAVFGRFSEGFETVDLRMARLLLDEVI